MSEFEPSRYLTKINGKGGPKDYLEVKWRLVWLREKHPDANISTTLERYDSNEAVVHAFISIPNGGSAGGLGSETKTDFNDYLEKAETKAIGRALAALGFGTQFCEDHDFDPEQQGRVVDSPVDFARTQGQRRAAAEDNRPSAPPQSNGQQPGNGHVAPEAITPRQIRFAQSLARECGLDDIDMMDELRERHNVDSIDQLSRRDASKFIEWLSTQKPQV